MYLERIHHKRADDDVTIPHEVVERSLLQEKSPVRAWREHKKLPQRQMAERMGISQPAYGQMEKAEASLRPATLKKIAAALEIAPAQLDF